MLMVDHRMMALTPTLPYRYKTVTMVAEVWFVVSIAADLGLRKSEIDTILIWLRRD
jgi:hypothetical protein